MHTDQAREPVRTAYTCQQRPWTRWWWLGNAVSEAEIVRHLDLLADAGFGGVEISPIYGVDGTEAQQIPFLSSRWLELLRFTVREARRRAMDVDLLCGTGWPFGGPWVAPADAAATFELRWFPLDAGSRLDRAIVAADEPEGVVQALVAFAADRSPVDITQYLDGAGRVTWAPPDGEWTLGALIQRGTGQQVKRAGPGGAGDVLDHYGAGAVARYLAHIEGATGAVAADDRVRCFFNDSFEVYGANWTADLLSEFQRRRGYDLRGELLALAGRADPDRVSRVRADYRHTIADLLLESFALPWSAWSRRQGVATRYQAHGSPGNLLDLYAAADVPETETFGTDWLRLAGLTPLGPTPPSHGGPADVLVAKLASSAAHLAGRPLCSSEVFTWLGEHGCVPLAHMKAELDLQFVTGINHVLFHGTPFSPADAVWPGWLFYASTHVGPTNPIWRDLPALNAYISRCQALLQAGRPDNDLLLYLPIFDLWASDEGTSDLLHLLTVHSEHWLDGTLPAFAARARQLWERGYSFDFVSDQLLEHVEAVGGRLRSGVAEYRALVLAGCTIMPPATLERIVELVRNGGTVLVVGELPRDVPGLPQLDERRRQLHDIIQSLGAPVAADGGIAEYRPGRGRLVLGSELETLLQYGRVPRESIVDAGVELIRRRNDDGWSYFVVNLGQARLDSWISLSVEAAAVLLADPVDGREGLARSRADDECTEVYVQLEPGESLLMRALHASVAAEPWSYWTAAGSPQDLDGSWQVEWIEGGPILTAPRAVTALASWTTSDDAALRDFAGTARYTIEFDRPLDGAEAWALELGEVCHSARVMLNGAELGTRVARPFRLAPLPALRERGNRLEIEVTNLMANRLAALDRQGVPWRNFFFVDITYGPFDASAWVPLPSGLLGPVRLLPLRRLDDR